MRSERGITIIETTVILSVLFILAGAMSPIVSESVTTARAVKAKNDASMIAMAIINLQKDLGGDALSFSSLALPEALHLPDVLATPREVASVDGTFLQQPELVWIGFRRRTGFGDSVMFMGPVRFTTAGRRHPLVDELRALVAEAQGEHGNRSAPAPTTTSPAC